MLAAMRSAERNGVQGKKAAMKQATDSSAVPMNTLKKSGLSTTTLIRCMAAIPWARGSCESACMMKVENAKKMPPTVPAPMQRTSPRIVCMTGVPYSASAL